MALKIPGCLLFEISCIVPSSAHFFSCATAFKITLRSEILQKYARKQCKQQLGNGNSRQENGAEKKEKLSFPAVVLKSLGSAPQQEAADQFELENGRRGVQNKNI